MRSRMSAGFASTASPGTSSASCAAPPIARARSSRRATRRKTRLPSRIAPQPASASSPDVSRPSREARRGGRSSSPGSAPRTSSGRSTSARPVTCSRRRTSAGGCSRSGSWSGRSFPMAWRWQRLLEARGVHDSYARLVRTYFVGYAAGQVLPTSLGGDASRIYETVRPPRRLGRRCGRGPCCSRARARRLSQRSCSLPRASRSRWGRYDVGGYLWVELAFVVGAIVAGVVLFSARLHPLLQRTRPLLRMLRIDRQLREVYLALALVFAATCRSSSRCSR